MDTTDIRDALLVMFRKQIGNWALLDGVAFGLSREGMTRLEIVRFFWDLMDMTPSPLTEAQIDLIGDFNMHLIGQCNIDQIVHLYDDPEDPHELATKVYEEVRNWRSPT